MLRGDVVGPQNLKGKRAKEKWQGHHDPVVLHNRHYLVHLFCPQNVYVAIVRGLVVALSVIENLECRHSVFLTDAEITKRKKHG